VVMLQFGPRCDRHPCSAPHVGIQRYFDILPCEFEEMTDDTL
jgi:hypothetical protein